MLDLLFDLFTARSTNTDRNDGRRSKAASHKEYSYQPLCLTTSRTLAKNAHNTAQSAMSTNRGDKRDKSQ